MPITNPYTNKQPFLPPSPKQAQTAAATNLPTAPKSFFGGISSWLGNTVNSLTAPQKPASGPSISNPFASNPLVNRGNTLSNPFGPVGGSDPAKRNAASELAYNQVAPTPKPQTLGTTTTANPQPAPMNYQTSSPSPTPNTQAQGGAIQNISQPTLLQQVAGSLANLRGNNPDVQKAYNSVANLESGLAAGNNAIMEKPIPLEFQQGQMAAMQRDYVPQLDAAKNILQSAVTGQGQELQGLQAAGQLAQPIQVPYSNQVISPLTGQPIGVGGQSGLSASVPDLAQAVLSGKMNWTDAQSQLGGIPTLTNLLRSAIQQQNPNFNFNLSASSAQTQQAGQQLQTFATSANAALGKLQSDFNNLPGFQTMGIPATIGVEQWLASQFGNTALSTYQTTLHDARAQLAGVLSTAGGMTPTGAEQTAQAYLPDNMTGGQLSSKIAAAQALIQQKVSAFTQSGQQSYQTGQSNNIYSF